MQLEAKPQADLAPMSAAEAKAAAQEVRQVLDQVSQGLAKARRLLVDLYRRRGWEALGYETWTECVTAEFGYSIGHVSKQLKAGLVEERITGEISAGDIPERWLREIARLPEGAQQPAWERIQESAPAGGISQSHVNQVVADFRQAPRNGEISEGQFPMGNQSEDFTLSPPGPQQPPPVVGRCCECQSEIRLGGELYVFGVLYCRPHGEAALDRHEAEQRRRREQQEATAAMERDRQLEAEEELWETVRARVIGRTEPDLCALAMLANYFLFECEESRVRRAAETLGIAPELFHRWTFAAENGLEECWPILMDVGPARLVHLALLSGASWYLEHYLAFSAAPVEAADGEGAEAVAETPAPRRSPAALPPGGFAEYRAQVSELPAPADQCGTCGTALRKDGTCRACQKRPPFNLAAEISRLQEEIVRFESAAEHAAMARFQEEGPTGTRAQQSARLGEILAEETAKRQGQIDSLWRKIDRLRARSAPRDHRNCPGCDECVPMETAPAEVDSENEQGDLPGAFGVSRFPVAELAAPEVDSATDGEDGFSDPEEDETINCYRCGLPLLEAQLEVLHAAAGCTETEFRLPAVAVTAAGAVWTAQDAYYCAGCGPTVQICRNCGCTEEEACDGGCAWADADLCSACVWEPGRYLQDRDSGRTVKLLGQEGDRWQYQVVIAGEGWEGVGVPVGGTATFQTQSRDWWATCELLPRDWEPESELPSPLVQLDAAPAAAPEPDTTETMRAAVTGARKGECHRCWNPVPEDAGQGEDCEPLPGGALLDPRGYVRTPQGSVYCRQCRPRLQLCRSCGGSDEHSPAGWITPDLCAECEWSIGRHVRGRLSQVVYRVEERTRAYDGGGGEWRVTVVGLPGDCGLELGTPDTLYTRSDWASIYELLPRDWQPAETAPAPDPSQETEQLAAEESPGDPLSAELRRALHRIKGSAARWEERRERGLSGEELKRAIGEEWEGGGGSSGPGRVGYSVRGGQKPAFWLGKTCAEGKPDLQGAPLVKAVRELLEIPHTGEGQIVTGDSGTLLEVYAGEAPEGAPVVREVPCARCRRSTPDVVPEGYNTVICPPCVEILEIPHELLTDGEQLTPGNVIRCNATDAVYRIDPGQPGQGGWPAIVVDPGRDPELEVGQRRFLAAFRVLGGEWVLLEGGAA